MQQSREPPIATGMVEFLNHLQEKDMSIRTQPCHSMCTPPINKVQDWDSAPPGYTSLYFLGQVSSLSWQKRNNACDSSFCTWTVKLRALMS